MRKEPKDVSDLFFSEPNSPSLPKHTEKRKTRGEEGFVGFAVIGVFLLPFAAAASAKRKVSAVTAFLQDGKALGNERPRLLAGKSRFNRGFFNVAQKVFVRAIKVAGVKISVALNNKLVGAVAAKAALLRPLAEEHSDVIVKKPDADVVPTDEVLDVKVERFDKKRG